MNYIKPNQFVTDKWNSNEYELLDCGYGEKLERWGEVITIRPEPQAIWPKGNNKLWNKPHAIYKRSSSGGGSWKYLKSIPEEWHISYNDIKFKISPTGFKHVGLFPEQAYNWDRIQSVIKDKKYLEILNLFGYTGAASIAAALAGASVCHVDASKGALGWCRENSLFNSIEGKIRLIQDDCVKFTEREGRRQKFYNGIIMDPPSFGRGAKGEVWKIEESFYKLIHACYAILADEGFILINSYSAGLSPLVVINTIMSFDINILSMNYGELCLPFREKSLLLPCGNSIFINYTKK